MSRPEPWTALIASCVFACTSSESGSTGSAGATGGGTGTGELGSPCTSDAWCASGICGPGDRCAAPCDGPADCPPAPEWSCAVAPGSGKICACAPSGAETCDGRDNDCNGEVDDGATCPSGNTCQAGACTCPPEHLCGGTCVDTSEDDAHCGGCEVVCPAPAHCAGGACTCAGGQSFCDGGCVDATSDPTHCGGCTTTCTSREICTAGACACAATQCGASCVDTENDPAHCAACGHDCQGGGCATGLCQQVEVFSGKPVWEVTTDAKHVYATTTLGEVMRADLDGTNVTTVTTVSASPNGLRHLAVDATHVYFGNYDLGLLLEAPLSGGPATTIATGTGVWGIALDGSDVFWTDPDGGEVKRTAKDGSSTTTIATGQAYPLGLALDATHAFWANTGDGSVMQANKDGSGAVVLASGQDKPAALAVESGWVYFGDISDVGPGGVFRVPVGGGAVALVAEIPVVDSLAVDDTRIYSVGAFQQLLSAPKTGGVVEVLLASVGDSRGVAVSADTIFLADLDPSGGLRRVAKP